MVSFMLTVIIAFLAVEGWRTCATTARPTPLPGIR